MGKNSVTLSIKVNDDGSFSLVQNQAKAAAKAVDGVTDSTKKLNKAGNAYHKTEKGIASAGANSTKNFSKMKQGMTGSSGIVAAYATLAANVFAVTAAFGALKRAAAFEQLAQGLNKVGAASGQNLPQIAKSLRDITGEAVSTKEAMSAVALGTSAGFSTTQMEGLTKVAKGASLALGRDMTDAMSRLTRGAAKLEPEILDELGIMVRLDNATKAYAASVGKTEGQLSQFERRMAFTNAIIEQGEKKFGAIADAIDVNPYDKLSATFTDLLQNVFEFINFGLKPLVGWLSESPTALAGALLFFGTTISGTILPQVQKLAAESAGMAASATANAANAMAATLNSNLKEMAAHGKKLSSFEFGGKTTKALEKNFRAGTASVAQYKTAIKNLEKSERERERRLQLYKKADSGRSAEFIKEKELELAAVKKLKNEIQSMQDAKKGQAGGVGGPAMESVKSVRARTGASAGSMAARGLDRMQGQGIAESFKTATKYSKLAFKSITRTTGALNTMKAAFFATGAAAKLFGAAMLQAIPVIGQIISLAMIVGSVIYDMFPDDVVKKQDEIIESFENFGEVSLELAGSLAAASTDNERYMLSLNSSVGIIDQVTSSMHRLNSARTTEVQKEVRELGKTIETVTKQLKDGEGRPWWWSLMPDSVIEQMLEQKLVGLNGQIAKAGEELAKDALDIESASAVISGAIRSIELNPSLASSTSLQQYRAELLALEERFKEGAENQIKTNAQMSEEMHKVTVRYTMGKAAIDAIGQSVKGLEGAISAFAGKTKEPLGDVIEKFNDIATQWTAVTNLKDPAAVTKFRSELNGIDPTKIGATVTKLKEAQTTMQNTSLVVSTQKDIMESLKGEIATSATKTREYYTAQNAMLAAQQEHFRAQLSIENELNLTTAQREVIIQKIAALEKKIATEGEIRIQEQVATLKFEEQKQKVIVKNLTFQKKALDLEAKINDQLAEQLDIAQAIAEERAISASFLEGNGGLVSAKQELELFMEQREEREQILEQESEMKIALIEMEYDLLEARVKTEELIAKQAHAAMPEKTDQQKIAKIAAKAALPEFAKMSKMLAKAEKQAINISKKAFDLRKLKNYNKGLTLAAKASSEFYEGIKGSMDIIADAGTKKVLTSMVSGFEQMSNIMLGRLDLAKTIADREVEIEKAKAAEIKAVSSGTVEEIGKAGEKLTSLKAAQADDEVKLADTAEQSKLSLASAGAGMTAGILEGLAATQDTTSKSGFESAKALQMGAAVMATAAAAMSEYSKGGPPAAAAAIAAGAIQIATIASTSFGGGGGGKTASISGGGAGSSTAGATGPRATSTKPEASKTVYEALATESLITLAKASNSASLSIRRVADGIQNIGELFEGGAKSSSTAIKGLAVVMDDIVRRFSRKTRLGFKVGSDNTSLVQTRGDTRVADKLLPAIENVMADVVKTIEEAAVGIGGAIDITKVNMQSFSFWSKRMGSDAASKMDMFKQFISEYANRVAATISGLPDAKDWRFADFDELLRLVGSLQTVNEAFRTFGKEIKLLDSSLTGANIAGGLVDLVGGAEAFKDAMELYGDVVLTESERSAGALYNSGENVKTAVDRMNEVLRQGGMSEFQMDTDMSQSEFKAAFETFSNLLGNAEYGDIAQTMIAGLLEALPQYEIQWEELDNLAEKEREYADLRADLLEEQGRSYEALSLRREWEIAELERIGDTEGARISALIHKEQDLNATRELELQILELSGRSQESLAIQRERELLGLKESDRVLQQRIWDLELENQAIDINLQIMKLSGQSMEALAIERQRELSTMDASLRPFQERLWALELEQQATDLNLQVMELSGQSMEALAITRQQELLSMDESLRPLQERVWALELEQEATDLNLQAMELSGRSMEALAITREQELLSMDESLRPLQERVWALELEQQATDLGIQAMELSGRSMEALAIQRQQELSQMDESLRPLQERVWALELEQQATDLNIQIMQLSGRSMEALAIQRQQELSQMDESLRPLQERVWALEVEEQASKLNIQIMQLSGRSMEALAIQRELELSQMDESLRPLQERVWALETEQQAQKITLKIMKLSGQSMEALAIQRELELSQMDESLRPLQERLWALELEQKATKLNLQIMKLSGQSMEALAIQREIELSKMDESLRPLQERVWALELEEDAQKLNLKAMKLSGQSMEALAIERQIELSKMDESLRPLQERVWALELEEDAQKLTLDIMRLSGRSMEALNIERQKELSLMDESLRPLQEAVWALELRNATIDAELELMRLTGMSIQALAIQREKELSAVDESMHAVKRATWEMQDAGEALSAAFAKRTEDYNANFEAVAQTYTDQITKTEESVSSLSSAVDSLTSFAQSQETVTRGVILRTIMQVRALTAEVKEGQYGGLENLSGYLSILGTDNKNLYGTFVDFRRDQTIASNALRDLEGAATVQLSTEELMLQTLNEQLEAETKHRDAQIQQWEEELNALLGINTSVMTVESAMTRFLLAQEAAANVLNGGVIATGVTDGTVMPDLSTTDLNLSTGADAAYSGTNTVETKLDTSQLEQELVKLREELSAANFQIAKNTSNTTRLLERWDGDGMPETRVIV